MSERSIVEQLAAQLDGCKAQLERLEALNQLLQNAILPLGIRLSAEPDMESLLERIALEAKAICHADMALLYLRTSEHQLAYAIDRTTSLNIHLGGKSGEPIPYPPLPLPAQPAVGAQGLHTAVYVALTGEVVQVDDIYTDAVFDFSSTREWDAATGYRSVSCLTVPLRDERVFGVLQLFNRQDPETGAVVPFRPLDRLLVESMATQVAVALHNHVLRRREEWLSHVEREIVIGRQLQTGFFPAALPQPAGWELAARFESAQDVAGDFYDVFQMPGGRLALVIADVCGKGVAAALFMALVRSLIRAYVQRHQYLGSGARGPAWQAFPTEFALADRAALQDAIALTNAYLFNNHQQADIFATLFFGALDTRKGNLLYVNAGHNPPLIIGRDGVRARLAPTGPALGLRADPHYRVGEATLGPGELWLGYTDGVSEARNAAGVLFSDERLCALAAPQHATAEALLTAVHAAVHTHTGHHRLDDDLTLLAARRLP